MRKPAPADSRAGAQSVRRALWRFAVPLCVCAAVPARICAQDNPAIRAAVQLAGEGRGDSARRLVEAELGRAQRGDSAYVEALYWRARLATYGDTAERDLRRVALEYSTSRWADDALLQLAQLAMTAGNPASAQALAERVRSDYPGSDLRAHAAYWAGRAALDMADVRVGCGYLDTARVEAAGDVEFQNQVAYYRGRCASLVSAPPPGRPRAPEPAEHAESVQPTVTAPVTPNRPTQHDTAQPGETLPARAAEGIMVQVAAARSDSEARRVVELMTRAGQRARIVTGPRGYRRVRIGPFPTLREAEAAAREARRVVGGTPFVVRGS